MTSQNQSLGSAPPLGQAEPTTTRSEPAGDPASIVAALRETQTALQACYDSSPLLMGVAELDGDAVVAVHGNAAAVRFFGQALEPVGERSGPELDGSPAVNRVWLESYRRSQRGEAPVRFEYRHPRPDGATWLSATVAFLGMAASGRPRFSFVAEDVTERKLADDALRRNARWLRDVIDGSPHLIVFLKDRDGRFLAVNSYLALLLGKSEQQIKGKTDYDLFPRAQADYFWSHDQRVLESGHAIVIEEEADLIDGHHTFLASKFPLRDNPGAIYGVGAISHDITERKRMERSLEWATHTLEEANRRKSEFLAALSHELRNPLTPVKNSLYILERTPAGSERARRATEVIERQVDQLARLVDDLLDITRISRGKIELQRRRFELGALVGNALDDHRALLERGGLLVRLVPAAGPLVLDADPNRIVQVLDNLLQNAIKFTPRGGCVTIALSADPEGRLAELRVADTGPGLSAESRARLFEPFMQADETLSCTREGLGLGLALVKDLVELHGGSVAARSEGQGQGAEFIVRLPLAAKTAADAGREEVAPVSSPCRRVLVIDDNVDAADSLGELLELVGHTVAVAYTGPDGIAKAQDFHPDVVLCDIGLPGMDGYAVALAFRSDEQLRDIHMVALTGYALPEDLERATRAGFAHHLAKPPSLEQLERVLGRR